MVAFIVIVLLSSRVLSSCETTPVNSRVSLKSPSVTASNPENDDSASSAVTGDGSHRVTEKYPGNGSVHMHLWKKGETHVENHVNLSAIKISAARVGANDDRHVVRSQKVDNEVVSSTQKIAGGDSVDATAINDLTWDDVTWILTASFIIFTMQTGFGMLESGCVSVRNESNIMMKNVVDVVFGGVTYWLFGYSLSFGTGKGSSPFMGVGDYMVDADEDNMGPVFAAFMFQLSFATTATTIVSGTMAERCNFKSYCIFSLLNTVVYCVPARWIWGPTGFLGELGAIDIAGSGAVHLLGGASGFVAAWMLGPRMGRYENGTQALPLGNPTSCIVGLYILWWGWLAFNSGSTFGVSGSKWKFAARAAVTTVIASIGGGVVGSVWTLVKPGRIFAVMDIVNTVLGALVGVTAGCALFRTVDAFIVGAIGGAIVILTGPLPDMLRVDDPVGATSVHAFGGMWGLIAVAVFAEDDLGLGFTKGNAGFLRGGDFHLLKVQLLTIVCITVWSVLVTFSLLWLVNRIYPIRMEEHEELLGADFVEHCVRRRNIGMTPVASAFRSFSGIERTYKISQVVGAQNPAHDRLNVSIRNLKEPWKKILLKTRAANLFVRRLRQLQEDQRGHSVTQRTIKTFQKENRADFVHEYLGSLYSTSINFPTTVIEDESFVYNGIPGKLGPAFS